MNGHLLTNSLTQLHNIYDRHDDDSTSSTLWQDEMEICQTLVREFLRCQEHLTSQSCPVLPYHVEVDSAGYRTLQILHSVSKLNLCAWDNLWRGLRDLSSCAILKPQVRKQGNRPTFIGIENKENQDAQSWDFFTLANYSKSFIDQICSVKMA